MSGKYDDIIHLPHPTSNKHPRMSIRDRAAMFSPFAALSGHGAAIAETARLTDRRMELDEDTRAELDQKQTVLLEHIGEQPEVTVTWFQPDERKDGGSYVTATGRLKKIDEAARTLILLDGTAIPLEDVGAAQKRLSELRGKIRALGAVNVAAIEEYEEVSGRYRFMKEQIDDAENAKKELTRLITELSAQMSAIFTERFAGINRYFGEIFRELFGGGHAELRLTDATDPLETGIEIIVQPPGKIIKNLSALSGGEQAFVAICIYFAILRVNPAPFVLIDEIEAALDDVNVGKFAAYLHRMTDHTQFISITHRRGTMEQGDVLYGVTREEEGISKLLRLDVAEMEKKFGKSLN